jgi:hypothetical protein
VDPMTAGAMEKSPQPLEKIESGDGNSPQGRLRPSACKSCNF